MLNRRTFLKLTGLAIAAPSLPHKETFWEAFARRHVAEIGDSRFVNIVNAAGDGGFLVPEKFMAQMLDLLGDGYRKLDA